MLTCILPSTVLTPAEAAAWYLTNPVLLAAYPSRMAATQAAHAAGQYTDAGISKLAKDLSAERKRLILSLPVEPDAPEAEAELRALLESRYLSQDERKDVSYRIHRARPSEYAWVRKPIEAAIQARAEEAMLKVALVARNTNTRIIPASQLSAAA